MGMKLSQPKLFIIFIMGMTWGNFNLIKRSFHKPIILDCLNIKL
jgi:hypothetical protein